MTVTTWTLTGDLLTWDGKPYPLTGSTPISGYVTASADAFQDAGHATLLGPTFPLAIAADGSFSATGIPDSSETGQSYTVTVTYRPAGHGRPRAWTSDPFTVNASGRFDEMPFVPPDISEAQRLAALTDAQVAALVADENGLTRAGLDGRYGTRGRWPVVNIVTDGAAPITDTETYVNGDYTITDTDGGVLHSGGLRIRGRGNTTWGLPKKPYRLNLDVKAELLGMDADAKNWALLANHYDDAKVNNHLAMTLGQRLDGLTWTPDYRVVEVVLNGDFLGVYQLADLVRMEGGRLDEDEPDADTGSGLTGTYLLEITNKEAPGEPEEGTDPGWTTSAGQWIIYDTPAEEDLSVAQIAYIQDYIDDFETALFGTSFANPTTGWRAYLDEASAVDWYIINELLRNVDSGFWSSCKLWKARDGKLHMGPLWDFDLSLGINIAGDFPHDAWTTRRADWFTRLFQDQAFWEAVAARWPQVLDELGDYQAFIDRLIDAETLAIGRDDTRWTQTTYTPLMADKRKRWLADRIAWLTPRITAAFGNPDYYLDTYTETY